MNLWLVLLLIISGFFLLFFRIKIYVLIRYRKTDNLEYIRFQVYLYKKVLVFTLFIPFRKDWKSSIGIKEHFLFKFIKKRKSMLKKKISLRNWIRRYVQNADEFRQLIKSSIQYYWSYQPVIKGFMQFIKCEHIKWKTVLGFEDVALTGQILGILCVFKEILIRRVKPKMNSNSSVYYSIIPSFGKTIFEMNFQCIFSVKLSHVISAIKKAYLIKRTKER